MSLQRLCRVLIAVGRKVWALACYNNFSIQQLPLCQDHGLGCLDSDASQAGIGRVSARLMRSACHVCSQLVVGNRG